MLLLLSKVFVLHFKLRNKNSKNVVVNKRASKSWQNQKFSSSISKIICRRKHYFGNLANHIQFTRYWVFFSLSLSLVVYLEQPLLVKTNWKCCNGVSVNFNESMLKTYLSLSFFLKFTKFLWIALKFLHTLVLFFKLHDHDTITLNQYMEIRAFWARSDCTLLNSHKVSKRL